MEIARPGRDLAVGERERLPTNPVGGPASLSPALERFAVALSQFPYEARRSWGGLRNEWPSITTT